ncbi:unnamed protein product [Prunus armeniaca]|uniref:Uncharacterized protein n=1 Tax=Prunus armeniaca TaxID=36596 RepID=A0A6J5WKZ2_PRUAR|nr:unnamed protein product [Prunus armeniaca]
MDRRQWSPKPLKKVSKYSKPSKVPRARDGEGRLGSPGLGLSMDRLPTLVIFRPVTRLAVAGAPRLLAKTGGLGFSEGRERRSKKNLI